MTDRLADKRPEEIEDEIARTRADMDSTLDAIQRRLSPSELVDQAMNYMKQNGAQDVLGGIGRVVRDNPMPLALIGLGCAWLLFSGGSPRRSSQTDWRGADGGAPHGTNGDGSFASVRDGATRIAASANEAAEAAKGGVRDAMHSVTERGKALGGYASDGVARARHSYESLIDERPLALGAVGLAIGAAVGLLLPTTRREDEALGEYRDQIFEQAQAAGREQVKKAQTVANEAWRAAKETVKEEATKQGLAGAPQQDMGGASEARAPGAAQEPKSKRQSSVVGANLAE